MKIIKDYVDHIDEEIEGAKTVSVCSAVIESAKTGVPVKVDYDFGV